MVLSFLARTGFFRPDEIEIAREVFDAALADGETVNAFALPNANRSQVTVTLPGSTNKVPALTAMRDFLNGLLGSDGLPARELDAGRAAVLDDDLQVLRGLTAFFVANRGCGELTVDARR